jgi:DnaJ-class molecular chaperone
MSDPYDILGVKRDASQDDIKKTYRTLAKQLHPDRHPGDSEVEERFKRVSAAYAILSDPELRARYDRGEIDGSGQERAGFHYDQAGGGPGGFAGGFNVEDIIGDLFGGRFGGGGGPGGRPGGMRARGQDVTYAIKVGFLEAATGGSRRVTLEGGRTLDITIPAGIGDGQTIRLKGQGHAGLGGGAAGDALIKVSVEAHPVFARDGDTVHMELPVTLAEGVLGAKVEVPTIDGQVTMSVPAGSSSGDTLRLKGKGLKRAKGNARGDQLVKLKLVLPAKPDPKLTELVREWSEEHPYSVR